MIGRGQTGNAKLVKHINREGILHQLRENPRVSRADLAKLTELSRPCVSALVDEMIVEGMISEVGLGESKGGRKPILLEYNFQAYGVIGAVFEGSTLQLAIADLKGELLIQRTTCLPHPMNGETAIQSIEQGLAALLNESGFDKARLLGMGLGLPGITQRSEGTVSYAPSTGWMGLPVRKEIEAALGLPVVIENDVNLMTLGEFHKGIGVGHSNLVYMYAGTGIGAGIMIDGQLYRGAKEASGEIGYMVIGPVGNQTKGEYGVFERNYSVRAIREKAKAVLPSMDEGSSIVKQIVDQANNGVEAAQALLDDICRHWTYGIANLTSVMDPALLILSGEMLHIGNEGIHKIQQWLTDWVPSVPRIEMASLGDQAGLIGAIHCALEAFPSTSKLQR
ncbi:Sugar kinase of the NBD/HSP70 family, may contain an N-terminal HTH domain [Paenibacillus tianmuensis]|uniref:Sugar kinase of the NBD/HSP70 family, may contain an N-terminal HTH domain n=1 Tax=Paenibacillus tianmuensis TaxID=624147 RepID=A0A1G4TAI8_9BACL|nr:ROK family transcriptional regulator [Paenibacillus tianmuensis]SCW78298.1 Sugar kinase of the NBD/HSP70 family, may contain an N-terminal HTH domain [Paenibacillus tianmuensis]